MYRIDFLLNIHLLSVVLIFQMLAREIIEDSILSYLTSEVLADNIDDNELSQKVLLAKEFML